MFISHVMTQQVITIDPDSDITEAGSLMARHRFRHLPVTREDDTLIGIVTDRDIRSAMPSKYLQGGLQQVLEAESIGVKVRAVMTKNPVTVSPFSTIQDALLLIEKTRVGAFPVVDENLKVLGMVSDRDLLKAFINFLGFKEPGTLLGIVADERIEEMERIVHAIIQEHISFGSILVARHWSAGKRAVFPYLFTKNIGRLKHKLRDMGYELLDPIEWYLGQRR
jgi:acetoin utilization protein AcuB